MRLIKPSFEILTSESDLKSATQEIEKAARTCYKSEDKIKEGSDLELIEKLISRGHEAMLEFGPCITVKFICDRGVSHELVRHRVASFAQESTRYCNYASDHIVFIIPPWTNIEEGVWDVHRVAHIAAESIPGEVLWLKAMLQAETAYNALSAKEWAPQQARSVLPNSLKTEIVIKANIREWRHIFKLRAANAAHPQMREVMIPLLVEMQEILPVLCDV